MKVSQSGVAAFASRHSNGKEVDIVLVNEAPSQTATVKLDLKLKTSPRTVSQYQVSSGSSVIAPSTISATAQPVVTLPPYSVTLIKVMER